jgi:hypothetical protein
MEKKSDSGAEDIREKMKWERLKIEALRGALSQLLDEVADYLMKQSCIRREGAPGEEEADALRGRCLKAKEIIDIIHKGGPRK